MQSIYTHKTFYRFAKLQNYNGTCYIIPNEKLLANYFPVCKNYNTMDVKLAKHFC